MTDMDAIRARLAAATSGLTPSPTRVNWAGNPGWFLPDALIAHLLAELDHADQLVEEQADRIDRLEVAETIVRALAQAVHDNPDPCYWCELCRQVIDYDETDPTYQTAALDDHRPACPARMAVEWAAATDRNTP